MDGNQKSAQSVGNSVGEQLSSSTLPEASRSPGRPRREPRPLAADFFFSLFWMTCCAAFIFGLWKIGPLVAERYQYSISRGRATAEYELASQFLDKNPLAAMSVASEMVARRVRPSVVNIECERLDIDAAGNKVWVGGQGSGIIVSEDGYILTNAHVISGSRRVKVKLHDRRLLLAKIVGSDEQNDIAVLKIESTGLIPAEWGDSENLQVGSMVWAVGSPFGLEQTVTSGIVSSKNRYRTEEGFPSRLSQREWIQTDAAVNKGNSGGPLVDAQGKVVGINTSIIGDQFQGISFAIPSSIAQFVSSQLITKGDVAFGFLGIRPVEISEQIADRLGLPDLNGARIVEVTPSSPAAKAGLMPGDILRQWNGIPIEKHEMVFRLVQTSMPGSVATVNLLRDGKSMDVQIELAANPDL